MGVPLGFTSTGKSSVLLGPLLTGKLKTPPKPKKLSLWAGFSLLFDPLHQAFTEGSLGRSGCSCCDKSLCLGDGVSVQSWDPPWSPGCGVGGGWVHTRTRNIL